MSSVLITILCALITSAGFWTLIIKIVDKRSAKSKMILGLGYNAIRESATEYIRRGSISQGEYTDFYKYLYKPYKDMGGDGSAERLMREVDKLPITPDTH